MNSLEKLISNLSTHWDIEPEKVVDRLNNMNESELKEIVNKMTKKYKTGGILDCLAKGGSLPECGCGAKMVKKGQDGLDTEKVTKARNDGVNGSYSREVLPGGTIAEILSRRNPDESVSYTERQITPDRDTTYYMYSNVTPMIDKHVQGNKYVTPTAYNKMGWLRQQFNRIRPAS